MRYAEKEINQIILEIAQKIYVNEIKFRQSEGHWSGGFQQRHARCAIECARNFAEVAIEKGLIIVSQPPLEYNHDK